MFNKYTSLLRIFNILNVLRMFSPSSNEVNTDSIITVLGYVSTHNDKPKATQSPVQQRLLRLSSYERVLAEVVVRETYLN